MVMKSWLHTTIINGKYGINLQSRHQKLLSMEEDNLVHVLISTEYYLFRIFFLNEIINVQQLQRVHKCHVDAIRRNIFSSMRTQDHKQQE